MTTLTLIEPVRARDVEGDAHLDRLCRDDDWIAEQKANGVRCLMYVDGGKATAISRNGLVLPGVKPPMLAAFEALDGSWIFDGEYVAQTGQLWLFDILMVNGVRATGEPWEKRHEALEPMLWLLEARNHQIRILPVARGTRAKRRLVQRVRDLNGEGVVLKRTAAPYTSGKSHDVLRAKNWHDIDVVVTDTGLGGKVNMAVGVYRAGKLVSLGEAGARSGDGRKVKVGDVVTLTIHGISKENKIVMASLPRIRCDKDPMDCTWDQLEPLRISKQVLR